MGIGVHDTADTHSVGEEEEDEEEEEEAAEAADDEEDEAKTDREEEEDKDEEEDEKEALTRAAAGGRTENRLQTASLHMTRTCNSATTKISTVAWTHGFTPHKPCALCASGKIWKTANHPTRHEVTAHHDNMEVRDSPLHCTPHVSMPCKPERDAQLYVVLPIVT
jgi:hypothetical protein